MTRPSSTQKMERMEIEKDIAIPDRLISAHFAVQNSICSGFCCHKVHFMNYSRNIPQGLSRSTVSIYSMDPRHIFDSALLLYHPLVARKSALFSKLSTRNKSTPLPPLLRERHGDLLSDALLATSRQPELPRRGMEGILPCSSSVSIKSPVTGWSLLQSAKMMPGVVLLSCI